MKIAQIVPGSGGGFYCENCLRDNDLAAALLRAGRDVLLVPLYLPLLPDNRSAAPPPACPRKVFFGGINVYLQQKSALFRHTPRWLDRLLDARWLLRRAARKAGMTRAADLAETTLSMLRGEHGLQKKELDRLVAFLAVERPDVAVLSNALLLGLAPALRERVGARVVCLLQDERGWIDAMGPPYAQQVWDLLSERAKDVDAFVAVSDAYARAVGPRLGAAGKRLHVIPCGLDAAGYAPADAPPAPPAVGFLAPLCADKGLGLLAEAYLRLRARPEFGRLRLRLAGGQVEADAAFVAGVRARLARHEEAGDVDAQGNLPRAERQEWLRSLSVLSVPTLRPEAFGVFVLEALASGVPVVLPEHGAFPELVRATGGGLLVRPNDPDALAAALGALLRDPDRARALGRAGRAAVLERFSAARAAERLVGLCRDVRAATPTGGRDA